MTRILQLLIMYTLDEYIPISVLQGLFSWVFPILLENFLY